MNIDRICGLVSLFWVCACKAGEIVNAGIMDKTDELLEIFGQSRARDVLFIDLLPNRMS